MKKRNLVLAALVVFVHQMALADHNCDFRWAMIQSVTDYCSRVADEPCADISSRSAGPRYSNPGTVLILDNGLSDWIICRVKICPKYAGAYGPPGQDYYENVYRNGLYECGISHAPPIAGGAGIGGLGAGPGLCSNKRPGSIIDVDNQLLGEQIPLVSIDFQLAYSSRWVAGYTAPLKIEIPLVGSDVNLSTDAFDIKIYNEINQLVNSATYSVLTPNLTHVFNTSGLKAGGGTPEGTLKYRVAYTARHGVQVDPREWAVDVGTWKANSIGVGGWVPSVYRFLDVSSGLVHSGDGSIRKVSPTPLGTGWRVPEEDGSLVNDFDSSGRVITIRNGLTGQILRSFNYSSGKLSSIVSQPGNRTTTFERDGLGKLVSMTSPYGRKTVVTLDANGYLSTLTGPDGGQYVVSASPQGLLKMFRKPNGAVTNLTYNLNGTLSRDAHASGSFFDLARNLSTTASREQRMTSKMGRITKVQYSENQGNSNYSQTLEPDGTTSIKTTRFNATNDVIEQGGMYTSIGWKNHPQFGASARALSSRLESWSNVSRSLQYTDTVTFTAVGNPFAVNQWKKVVTVGGKTTTSIYDGISKRRTVTSPMNRISEVDLDGFERPVRIKQGNLTETLLNYVDDKLTSIAQGPRVTAMSYSARTGRLASVTDAVGRTTRYGYDSADRLIAVTGPDARTQVFSYDGVGHLVSVNPASAQLHQLNYGANELLKSYKPPILSGVPLVETSYTYNADDQLTSIARPDGKTVGYIYNATTGVMTSYSTDVGNFPVQFNSYRRLSQVKAPDGATAVLNWIGSDLYQQSYSLPTGQGLWQFGHRLNSTFGDVQSETINGQTSAMVTVDYTYDDERKMVSAGDLSFSYDGSSSLQTGSALGVTSDSFRYNSFGEIISYEGKVNSSTVYSESLTRDDLGRIVEKTENINGAIHRESYNYNPTGLLTKVTRDSVTRATYNYDVNNNRISSVIDGVAWTGVIDAQDRLVRSTTATYAYSAAGDLITRTPSLGGAVLSTNYDALSNLRSATVGSSSISYAIDGLNRRVIRKVGSVITDQWIYDERNRIVGDLAATGALRRRYVYGSKSNVPDYFIEAGVKYRIFSDHLGSPRIVLRASDGVVMQIIEHDEFGRIRRDTKPGYIPFGFAGGIYDKDTGLVRFGARDYDPYTGRWTSKDPIRFAGGDTNLYGYVANDPINWTDPSGLKMNFVFQGGNLTLYEDNGQQLFSGPGVSGPYGNGALPQGRYSVGGMRDNRSGSYSCSGSSGYSLDLNPQFSTNRTDLRIHPDGGVPGTLGCIGVNCGNGNADALGDLLRGIYNQPMTPWIDLEVR